MLSMTRPRRKNIKKKVWLPSGAAFRSTAQDMRGRYINARTAKSFGQDLMRCLYQNHEQAESGRIRIKQT